MKEDGGVQVGITALLKYKGTNPITCGAGTTEIRANTMIPYTQISALAAYITLRYLLVKWFTSLSLGRLTVVSLWAMISDLLDKRVAEIIHY